MFIIAVDFDGTLVKDKFPEIGEALPLIEYVKYWKGLGAKVILWTCRHGKALEDAVTFCNKRGLVFDAVNQNLPEIQEKYGTDTRKVFADIYIDDKAVLPVEVKQALLKGVQNAIRKADSRKDN